MPNITGKFVGRLELTPLPNGRDMEVLKPFNYEDHLGEEWPVPDGIPIDGASIPRPLWSVIGGPYSGKYLKASVIHDHFCRTKTRPWKRTHRVFYEGMLTAGTKKSKAKTMYAAVYWFGGRWPTPSAVKAPAPKPSTASAFANRSDFSDALLDAFSVEVADARALLTAEPDRLSDATTVSLDFRRLYELIEEMDPSLDEIEGAIDLGAALPGPATQDDETPVKRSLYVEPGFFWEGE